MRFWEDYRIDGMAILVPDENAEIGRSDLDSAESGRDEAGFMHRVVLRSRVKTWSFAYSVLKADEYRYMKSLFDGKSTFSFSYIEDGIRHSTEAYCSNDSVVFENTRTGLYKNFKVKIIEC